MFRRVYSFCGISVEAESFSSHPLDTLGAAWREESSPNLLPNINFQLKIVEEFSSSDLSGEEVPVLSSPSPRYNIKTRTLTIEHPHPENYKPDIFPHFIFFPAFQHMLHLEGVFSLHASAVELNQKIFIFTGTSGSGKSTSAGAMIGRGARLIADDRLLLFQKDQDILAAPSPQKQNPFARGPKILKGGRSLLEPVDPSRALPIHKIFFTTVSADSNSTIEKVSSAKAMAGLMSLHADRLYSDEKHLNLFSLAAKTLPTFALTLGRGADSLYDQIIQQG